MKQKVSKKKRNKKEEVNESAGVNNKELKYDYIGLQYHNKSIEIDIIKEDIFFRLLHNRIFFF